MLQYMGEGIKELRHSNQTAETAEPVSKQPKESTHGNKLEWVALQRDGWITQTQSTANVISEHIECQIVALIQNIIQGFFTEQMLDLL